MPRPPRSSRGAGPSTSPTAASRWATRTSLTSTAPDGRGTQALGGAAIPTLGEIEAARGRIRGVALRTPLVRLNAPDLPGEIYLKLESLQPIGSFKIRGAANAM